MWFRLAALWGCPVAEAMRRCPESEFVEWCAFHHLEGIGEWRSLLDLLFASAKCTAMSPHLKQGARMKIKDAMLFDVEKSNKRLVKSKDDAIKALSAAKVSAFLCGWPGTVEEFPVQ